MSHVYLFGAGASCEYRGVRGGFFNNRDFFEVVEAMWREWTEGRLPLAGEVLEDCAPDHYDGGKWRWPDFDRLLKQACGDGYRELGLEATFGEASKVGRTESDLYLRAIELALFHIQRAMDSNSLAVHLGFLQKAVRPDDVFLTFNYDPLIEQALRLLQGEADISVRWHPSDGYGLELQPLEVTRIVREGTTARVLGKAPAEKHMAGGLDRSNVTVLKLHGSVDWLCPADVAPSPPFGCLREFDHEARGQGFQIYWDKQGPLKPVIVPPLPVKDYEQVGLVPLWEQAAEALSVADALTVIGYSLPATDTAACELLARAAEKNPGMAPVTFVTRSRGASFDRFRRIFPNAKLVIDGFAAYADSLPTSAA